MSLIQDALKRKTEESQPSAPTGLQESPAPAKNPHVLMVTLIVLLIAVLLALLAGLAFYLIRASGPIHEILPKVSAPLPEKAPEPVAAEPQPEVAFKTPEPPAPEIYIEPAAPEPVPGIPVEWPELKLTGIATKENQGIAIINGRMLTAGRTLNGIIVREVREADVVLEYGGERRILHIND